MKVDLKLFDFKSNLMKRRKRRIWNMKSKSSNLDERRQKKEKGKKKREGKRKKRKN